MMWFVLMMVGSVNAQETLCTGSGVDIGNVAVYWHVLGDANVSADQTCGDATTVFYDGDSQEICTTDAEGGLRICSSPLGVWTEGQTPGTQPCGVVFDLVVEQRDRLSQCPDSGVSAVQLPQNAATGWSTQRGSVSCGDGSTMSQAAYQHRVALSDANVENGQVCGQQVVVLMDTAICTFVSDGDPAAMICHERGSACRGIWAGDQADVLREDLAREQRLRLAQCSDSNVTPPNAQRNHERATDDVDMTGHHWD